MWHRGSYREDALCFAGEDRLAFSVIWQMSADGDVIEGKTWFGAWVMLVPLATQYIPPPTEVASMTRSRIVCVQGGAPVQKLLPTARALRSKRVTTVRVCAAQGAR